MNLLVTLLVGIALPSATDRAVFEPYRQCVLIASRYSSAVRDIREVVAAAEAACQRRLPIGFIDQESGQAEIRYTTDRSNLPSDVHAALIAELRAELARQRNLSDAQH